ncbi:MAG: hypothetical protein Q9166_006335 [cf. Caloplaca sp. 2 TL-2023]
MSNKHAKREKEVSAGRVRSRIVGQLDDLCTSFKKRIMDMEWEGVPAAENLNLDIAITRSILDLAARIDIDQFSTRVWDTYAKQSGRNYQPYALFCAAKHNAYHLAKSLLDRGVYIDALLGGMTALHKAVEQQNMSTVELLLNKGANIEGRDDEHETPLLKAVAIRSTSLIIFLLSKGANIEARDARKRTPLHRAVATRSTDVVTTLLSKGAIVNSRDPRQETPLHKAVLCAPKHLVVALVLMGADINAQDIDSESVLMYAVENGKQDIVRYLLSQGARRGTKDRWGSTALDYATKDRNDSITSMLRVGHADTEARELSVNPPKDIPVASSSFCGEFRSSVPFSY